MSEKIMSLGIKREKGWLYYLDSNLNLCRAEMVRGGKKKRLGSKPELLLKTGQKRDPNYLYYLDKTGDISRVKASRGGTLLKGKKHRRTPAQKKALLAKKLALKKKRQKKKKIATRKNTGKKVMSRKAA